MTIKHYYHIGFAVDTANGLVVPVIRDVDQKGVMAIARELSELSVQAREGKLKLDQMQGASFTVSSLGDWRHGLYTDYQCARGGYSWCFQSGLQTGLS